ncbi:MAG: hypothetical protein ABSB33_07945 [Tepidisphaeraceae bacterium]|jgi:hypothetical protein
MKRLAMYGASGLMALLPSIASARPHFFFGFDFCAPLFAGPYFAPPACYAPAATYVSPPVVYTAPPVTYVAGPVVYAPVPAYSYYAYGYPAYGYYHRYAYVNRAPVCFGGARYYYGGYRR